MQNQSSAATSSADGPHTQMCTHIRGSVLQVPQIGGPHLREPTTCPKSTSAVDSVEVSSNAGADCYTKVPESQALCLELRTKEVVFPSFADVQCLYAVA